MAYKKLQGFDYSFFGTIITAARRIRSIYIYWHVPRIFAKKSLLFAEDFNENFKNLTRDIHVKLNLAKKLFFFYNNQSN